ncbi:MAG: xylose isomerase [Chitinispirillales bacterium]|jgi:xylose isomerase|nr:xylose isomerase [Chitinispirillales bacterium]
MADYFVGAKEYFPGISKIKYEGPKSKNPLAFKYYDAEKLIGGKTMKDHLRFGIAYWHSFCGDGGDPFGAPTHIYPWNTDAKNPMDAADKKMDAAFEFFTKIGAGYYTFHDRDMAPEGANPAESEKNLFTLTDKAKKLQKETGVKLLWGTAGLSNNPRYMNGVATNPEFGVVALAATQVKATLDATIALDGEGFTFWGGREGYMSILNTDIKREKENMARFLTMARDYGRKQGFKGMFYIEPKPMEPSKHQYDFDTDTVVGFLRHYGLDKDFRMNIEANHAELASHDFAHELETAAAAGMFGSIDANRGDSMNGWDTDQFAISYYETTLAMYTILKIGGFTTGGLNFDAKVRRNSVDPADLFIGHIGSMDAFAVGLQAAQRIIDDGVIPNFVKERYASFDSGDGAKYSKGEMTLEQLAKIGTDAGYGTTGWTSGKQEYLENVLNGYLLGL